MGRPQQTRNATDWRLVQFMANPRQSRGYWAKGSKGVLIYVDVACMARHVIGSLVARTVRALRFTRESAKDSSGICS